MPYYTTEYKDYSKIYKDNRVVRFSGPTIEAINFEEAEYKAKKHPSLNLKVTGELVSEIDWETGERTDYDYHLN